VLLMLRAAAVFAAAGLALAIPAEAKLRINGSTTVNPVVSEAAAILRTEAGLEIQVDTVGGSSGGIAALADGRAEMAMSSRPVSEADRRRFPGVEFHPVRIGIDALALVVSSDVWTSGIRCLDRRQVQGLYEGRIRNWSDLGGPDQRVVFFNKEPGRGTWEVFATWLYGSSAAAPLVSLPEVGSNAEARSKVASTRGAITQLSAAWADGESAYALAICDGDEELAPTAEAVLAGRYPLARPLYVITNGAPDADSRRLIVFVLGERGQALVERHGYLPLPTRSIMGGARP
jgi:phosphate transport system substrate-binding protein